VAAEQGSLAGTQVLVTGASRGIGAATATQLAARGARVIRVARSPMPLLGGAADFAADLADPVARRELLRQISAAHGVPDAVVSNAGSFVLAPLEETTDAMLRGQLAINVEAPLAIARHFLPAMRRRGTGSHLLVGSIADHRAFAGNAAYAMSKFAVRGLHEVLCEEFRGSGVSCTLISPGPTDTAIWDPYDPDAREGFTPRAAMLRADDVATTIVTLLLTPPPLRPEWVRLEDQ
jgi:NAD(P)-dependent dehydrogenase (short-subunit alcohol dehydrogenase family)